MNIIIQTIPHKSQRYPTCGDWQFGKNSLSIHVSELGDWRMESLIAIHELIEAVLCKRARVKEADVDSFDLAFKGDGEPGDEANAPYYRQHQIATGIERLLAAEMKVDWQKYEAKINAL